MKIVGVTACTVGIAHTYMAQEAIEKECRKRGYEYKVETQGGMGLENELTQKDVDTADFVILAISVDIEGQERFEEKKDQGLLLIIDPNDAIKNTPKVFDEMLKILEEK